MSSGYYPWRERTSKAFPLPRPSWSKAKLRVYVCVSAGVPAITILFKPPPLSGACGVGGERGGFRACFCLFGGGG